MNIKGVPTSLGPVTFANLPSAAGRAGAVIFCSNARKASEAAGVGTGNLLFSDGTNWIRTDTGVTAVA